MLAFMYILGFVSVFSLISRRSGLWFCVVLIIYLCHICYYSVRHVLQITRMYVCGGGGIFFPSHLYNPFKLFKNPIGIVLGLKMKLGKD